MNPPTEADFQRTAETVPTWNKPLLLSHAKPDGDAVGSLVAVRAALRAHGLSPLTVVFDDVPDRYQFLIESDPLTLWVDVAPRDRDAIDGVLVLDTCSYGQLEPAADWLRTTDTPIIAVDHHISRDLLATAYLVDERASATCLILKDWFRTANWTLDRTTADALFVGIATDTGWFRHSNTDARTLEAATELAAAGAQPHQLFELLFQRERLSRFRLRAAAAQRLELLSDNRIAVTTLPKKTFEECGAALSETEDLVNEPLRIAGVIVSIMLVEQDGNIVRVGLRSRAPIGDEFPDVDVAMVARTQGGGGHKRAAGVRISGTIDDAKQAMLAQVTAILSS